MDDKNILKQNTLLKFKIVCPNNHTISNGKVFTFDQ